MLSHPHKLRIFDILLLEPRKKFPPPEAVISAISETFNQSDFFIKKMAEKKSSNSKLSNRVSNTRNKTAILSLSILFTAIGILWQEKYISFGLYAIFTATPLYLNFLLISIAIGFLSLFWIFKHNRLVVKKGFKEELEPSIEYASKSQKNILGEYFLEPDPKEKVSILNSKIDIIPTEILEKEAETIAELSDETRDIVIRENQLEPRLKY